MLSLYHVTKGCVLELKKTQTKKKKKTKIILNSTTFKIKTPSTTYYPEMALTL